MNSRKGADIRVSRRIPRIHNIKHFLRNSSKEHFEQKVVNIDCVHKSMKETRHVYTDLIQELTQSKNPLMYGPQHHNSNHISKQYPTTPVKEPKIVKIEPTTYKKEILISETDEGSEGDQIEGSSITIIQMDSPPSPHHRILDKYKTNVSGKTLPRLRQASLSEVPILPLENKKNICKKRTLSGIPFFETKKRPDTTLATYEQATPTNAKYSNSPSQSPSIHNKLDQELMDPIYFSMSVGARITLPVNISKNNRNSKLFTIKNKDRKSLISPLSRSNIPFGTSESKKLNDHFSSEYFSKCPDESPNIHKSGLSKSMDKIDKLRNIKVGKSPLNKDLSNLQESSIPELGSPKSILNRKTPKNKERIIVNTTYNMKYLQEKSKQRKIVEARKIRKQKQLEEIQEMIVKTPINKGKNNKDINFGQLFDDIGYNEFIDSVGRKKNEDEKFFGNPKFLQRENLKNKCLKLTKNYYGQAFGGAALSPISDFIVSKSLKRIIAEKQRESTLNANAMKFVNLKETNVDQT